MIGFILAAGFGTRLRPLTEHIPKALVPVCGIPLLERNLSFLHRYSVKEIAVNSHYLPDQIQSFKDTSAIPFTVYHEKGEIRGTGGALYFAREFLMSDEIFCIVNADILSNVNIRKLSENFRQSEEMCALVAAPPQKKGTIFCDPETGEYRGIPSDVANVSNVIGIDYIGMAFYKRKILDYIDSSDFSVIPIWKRIQEKGHFVKVYIQDNIYWYDTGTPLSLARIHFDMLDGKVDLAVPETMCVDHTKKIAYPKGLSDKKQRILNDYSWIESDTISLTASISRSIVLAGVQVKDNEKISDVIYSKWGGIPFEQ